MVLCIHTDGKEDQAGIHGYELQDSTLQLHKTQCQCKQVYMLSHSPIIQHIFTLLSVLSCIAALMYTAAVVNLPHINQLLAPTPCDLIGQLLGGQGLPSSLDDVHLVARAGRFGRKILQAGGAGEFEDEMLDAETEA